MSIRSSLAVFLFLFVAVGLQLKQEDNYLSQKNAYTLFDSEGAEYVYFFSYHCDFCYRVSNVLDVWSSVNDINIERVPVVSKEWSTGAHLHFLMHLTSDFHTLSKREINNAGYSIVSRMDTAINQDFEYAKMLRGMGMEIHPLVFQERMWLTKVMVKSSAEIIESLNVPTLSTPSLRVVVDGQVQWLEFKESMTDKEMVDMLNGVNR